MKRLLINTTISFKKLLITFTFLSSVLLCVFSVNAEQMQQFSNLEVHYIAIPSTFIQPNIAKQYNIKRSKNNGLLNISILNKALNNQAISATLTGTGKNLIGQTYELTFSEVKEGKAIYYLAEYPFTNEEIVNFNIKIKTDNKSNTLKFQHKFYVD